MWLDLSINAVLSTAAPISLLWVKGESFSPNVKKKDLVSLTPCTAKSLMPVLYVCTGISQCMQGVLGL